MHWTCLTIALTREHHCTYPQLKCSGTRVPFVSALSSQHQAAATGRQRAGKRCCWFHHPSAASPALGAPAALGCKGEWVVLSVFQRCLGPLISTGDRRVMNRVWEMDVFSTASADELGWMMAHHGFAVLPQCPGKLRSWSSAGAPQIERNN